MEANEASSLVGGPRVGRDSGRSALRVSLLVGAALFVAVVALSVTLIAQMPVPALEAAAYARELPVPPEAAGHLLAFEYGNVTAASKVAVFDFDGTLASPVVCMGSHCPEHVWQGYREFSLTFPAQWRGVLRDLVAQGYKIVIVSNQGPLVNGTAQRDDLVGRDVEAAGPAAKQVRGDFPLLLLSLIPLLWPL